MNVYLLVAFGSFLVGLLRLPRWTIAVFPAISVGWGVAATLTEPPNYDMPGLGLYVGMFMALACAIAWLLGRGLAIVAERLQANGSPRD